MAPPLLCPAGTVPILPNAATGFHPYEGHCEEVTPVGRLLSVGPYQGFTMVDQCDGVQLPGTFDPAEINEIVGVARFQPGVSLFLDLSIGERGHLCVKPPNPESSEAVYDEMIARLEDRCSLAGDKCEDIVEALQDARPSNFMLYFGIGSGIVMADLFAAAVYSPVRDFNVMLVRALNPLNWFRFAAQRLGALRAAVWTPVRADYAQAWVRWRMESQAGKCLTCVGRGVASPFRAVRNLPWRYQVWSDRRALARMSRVAGGGGVAATAATPSRPAVPSRPTAPRLRGVGATTRALGGLGLGLQIFDFYLDSKARGADCDGFLGVLKCIDGGAGRFLFGPKRGEETDEELRARDRAYWRATST